MPPYLTNGMLRTLELDLELVAVAAGPHQHGLLAQR